MADRDLSNKFVILTIDGVRTAVRVKDIYQISCDENGRAIVFVESLMDEQDYKTDISFDSLMDFLDSLKPEI